MKLEDFNQLKNQEISKVLRRPESALYSTPADLIMKNAIFNSIVKMLDNQFYVDNLKEFIHTEQMFKSNFNLEGEGTPRDPFKISCKYGKGTFYHARQLFNQGRYPNYIHYRKCHSNTYDFCRNYSNKSEAIIGICFKDKPFLHSVMKAGNLILDFNYDLVMSADLYFSLLSFETLNIVDNLDIQNNHSLFVENLQNAEQQLAYADVLACYYELKEMFENKTTDNIV